MMFFCNVACLLMHQQVCSLQPQSGLMRGWRSSYGNIRPWQTLRPHQNFTSLYIRGTPFRKVRAGCEDCLDVLQPLGRWLGAGEHAKKICRTLIWATWTISLTLKRAYQNRNVKPMLQHLLINRFLTKYNELRNLLLDF